MEIRRGFLYLADLNPPHGTEPGKLRPVVVIQSDLLNETGHSSTWILPCTTKFLPENLLRIHLPRGIAGNEKECDIMIDQSRTIDNRRFCKKLSRLPDSIIKEVEEKIRLLGEL